VSPAERWHRAIAASLRWAIDEAETADEVKEAGHRNAAAVAVLVAEAPAIRAEVLAYAKARMEALH
jgi:hypothetical protein